MEIYSAIRALRIHFHVARFSPPSSNGIICGKGAGLRGQKRKEETAFFPYLPAALPFLPSLFPPLINPSPLPAATGIPSVESGRRESPNSLTAALCGLGLAAEPLGDNFDCHNDAGGNHFKEDQSSLKAAPHLPQLRPTLPDPPSTVPARQRPNGRDSRTLAEAREDGDGTRRSARELLKRLRDPDNLGAGRGPASPHLASTQTPTRTPSSPFSRHTQNIGVR